MTRKEVKEKIVKIVKYECAVDIKDSDMGKLWSDLGVDSLDCILVAMALEDEFGCEISDEIAARFKTPEEALEALCLELKMTA